MSKTLQTNSSADPGNPPKRRRGGQPGNRNAAKPLNTLSRRIRDLKRRACEMAKLVP